MSFKDLVDQPITEAERQEMIAKITDEKIRQERFVKFLSDLYAEVEKRNVVVARMEMSPSNYVMLKKGLGKDHLDICTSGPILRTGMMATLWGAPVYVGNVFGEPRVYAEVDLPPEDGILWIRQGWEVAL